ncbi:MAG: beta strand repeat-containing protein [Candidatus Acidiferrales bacterium]
MGRKIRIFATLVIGVGFALSLTACGGGGGGGNNPNTTISVVIYPGSATVPINGVINFSAVVYNFTANGGVNWTASAGAFAGSVFTAPGTTGNVTVTATSQEDTSKTATVTVMVSAAQPLAVSPAALALPALGTQTFTTTAAGVVAWSVTASNGSDPGTIDQSGHYTAPRTPPSGGTVTVSATTNAGSGTATVTVFFSPATLSGQYAFSYAGEDVGGFLAVAGTFTTDGAGAITGGVEDVNSGAAGIVENIITGGSLQVNPDGRAIVTVTTGLGTVTWQVTILSNQHALLVRFDSSATGSGTIDKANPVDFSVNAIANNYAFGISGIDSGGFPMAIAGRFLSDGNGTFPINSAIQDVNDSGTITQADVSLHGDIINGFVDPSTGRGTLEFISTVPGTGTLTFAFYITDNTHFKIVEIDAAGAPVLAGDAFSAPNSITLASLTGSYAFTVGGSQTAGPYAAGGVFTASGTGTISGGVQDLNEQANVLHLAQALSTSGSSYTLTPSNTSNRILLTLSNGSTSFIYAVYPTSNNSAEIVEVDKAILISSGMAFLQSSTSAPSGNYGFNTTGQTNNGEQDINGSVAAAGSTALTGYLDINETGNIFLNTPLAGSSIAAPGNFGRGTLTLATAKPTSASFTLAYYVVDDSTVLVLEMDHVAVTLGTMARQF